MECVCLEGVDSQDPWHIRDLMASQPYMCHTSVIPSNPISSISVTGIFLFDFTPPTL